MKHFRINGTLILQIFTTSSVFGVAAVSTRDRVLSNYHEPLEIRSALSSFACTDKEDEHEQLHTRRGTKGPGEMASVNVRRITNEVSEPARSAPLRKFSGSSSIFRRKNK